MSDAFRERSPWRWHWLTWLAAGAVAASLATVNLGRFRATSGGKEVSLHGWPATYAVINGPSLAHAEFGQAFDARPIGSFSYLSLLIDAAVAAGLVFATGFVTERMSRHVRLPVRYDLSNFFAVVGGVATCVLALRSLPMDLSDLLRSVIWSAVLLSIVCTWLTGFQLIETFAKRHHRPQDDSSVRH